MRKSRILRSAFTLAAAVMAMVVVPVAAGAAPGGSGRASQAAPQATLVRTHVFLPGPPSPARGNGGKPQPAANCSPDDGSSSDPSTFTTTGFLATGRDAVFNTATIPASLINPTQANVADVVSSAFTTWTDADAKAPHFNFSATNSGVTKETANHETDVLWGRTPGNAIAVTYTWHWNDGSGYESDTVFSNRLPWAIVPDTTGGCNTAYPSYDVQDIATHEFGHIYGLDHDPQRFATMYAYGYTGETLKRSLDVSDKAGIQSLY